MSFFEFPHTRTYDSDLGWLIKNYNSIHEIFAGLEAWKNQTEPKIEELMDFMEAMEKESTMPQSVKDAIYDWCRKNLVDLVGSTIKSVFFGITDDGYFVAYIPDSWSDITFNTTYYDIVLVDHPEYGYGHLVLSY